MAGTTTNFGFDYPTSTDYVKDGATAIQALANDVDARFGNVATYPNQIVNVVSGVSRPVPFATSANRVSFSAPASVPGAVAVTVTFPASRFTQTPVVVLTQTSAVNAVQRRFAASSASSTGFTAGYYQDNGSAAATSVDWIAIQMTSASGVG